MPRWKLISGARPFYELPNREGVAIGWARDLQRGETQFTVNVVVSQEAQEAADLPPEAREAIRSHGRSVINALLGEETLPYIVDVTPGGLVRDYEVPAAGYEADTEAAAEPGEGVDDDAPAEETESSEP